MHNFIGTEDSFDPAKVSSLQCRMNCSAFVLVGTSFLFLCLTTKVSGVTWSCLVKIASTQTKPNTCVCAKFIYVSLRRTWRRLMSLCSREWVWQGLCIVVPFCRTLQGCQLVPRLNKNRHQVDRCKVAASYLEKGWKSKPYELRQLVADKSISSIVIQWSLLWR